MSSSRSPFFDNEKVDNNSFRALYLVYKALVDQPETHQLADYIQAKPQLALP